MRKFLFLLIILGCAVYWGMSQGDDLSRQAKASHGGAVSAQPVKPEKVSQSWQMKSENLLPIRQKLQNRYKK